MTWGACLRLCDDRRSEMIGVLRLPTIFLEFGPRPLVARPLAVRSGPDAAPAAQAPRAPRAPPSRSRRRSIRPARERHAAGASRISARRPGSRAPPWASPAGRRPGHDPPGPLRWVDRGRHPNTMGPTPGLRAGDGVDQRGWPCYRNGPFVAITDVTGGRIGFRPIPAQVAALQGKAVRGKPPRGKIAGRKVLVSGCLYMEDADANFPSDLAPATAAQAHSRRTEVTPPGDASSRDAWSPRPV